jgi:hypothetical protein
MWNANLNTMTLLHMGYTRSIGGNLIYMGCSRIFYNLTAANSNIGNDLRKATRQRNSQDYN